MNPKKVHVGDEGKSLLRQGVSLFSEAVKSTLGPSGKSVLLEDPNIVGGYIITKDGITVAKSIRFEEPVMDMAANMMRQASEGTSRDVGDGTTTSVVLTEAILNAFDQEYDVETESMSIIDVTRGIHSVKDDIVSELQKMAVPADTIELMEGVASISTNNDKELGALVAEVMSQVDEAVIEVHGKPETTHELIVGVTLGRGWTSPYFANDERRRECVLENPYILICDKEIKSIQSIEMLLREHFVSMEGRPAESLLIISPVSSDVLATLAMNAVKGGMKVCVVHPPSMGVDSKDRMADLVKVFGGTYFSKDMGDDFQLININGLGQARKVRVTDTETIIEPLFSQGENMLALTQTLKELKEDADDVERGKLDARIQSICGKHGVITVGAFTPIELKEKKDRIDDAVCAVKAAKTDGILPGGGVALINAMQRIPHDKHSSVALNIMSRVVEAPLRQMLKNAGHTSDSADIRVQEQLASGADGWGLNIKTGVTGNMIEMGVIDPFLAVKKSIENAVSVACTILNTECVVSHIREPKHN